MNIYQFHGNPNGHLNSAQGDQGFDIDTTPNNYFVCSGGSGWIAFNVSGAPSGAWAGLASTNGMAAGLVAQSATGFANAQRIGTATISNGGSGYKVDEYLRITGGCMLLDDTIGILRIVSVSGSGAVTGVQIINYGGWVRCPTTPNPCVGGSGSGFQINIAFTLYWQNVPWIVPNSSGIQAMLDLIVQKPASAMLGGLASASITDGGLGYVVGDVLTIAGGTLLPGAQAATLIVDGVSHTGKITAYHLLTYGGWSVTPSSPNSPAGGTGTGAVVVLAFNAPVNRADKCVAMAVEKIQSAIRNGHRIPLSVTPLSIPPEAESHCYALAIQMMIGALPSLQGYVTNPPQTSGKPPLVVMFEAAAEWMKEVRAGRSCEYPSDPDPTFQSAVRYGSFSHDVDLTTDEWLGGSSPYGDFIQIGQP